jgi:uncharacterized protein (TIGR02246 family)
MPDATADEAAIRTLVEDWAAAVRREDMEAVLRHHASDLLMFDVPPPFQVRGIDAYRETWRQFFGWSHDPVPFQIQTMEVVAGAEVAVVMATVKCAEPDAKGQPMALDFRLTIGLRKIDGQWTIFHEHHSVPAQS